MRLIFCSPDASFGRNLLRCLEQAGHTVEWLSESLAPHWLSTPGACDAVLLDLGAGRSGPLETLRRAARGQPEPLALVFAEGASAARRIELLDAGADEVLDKPVDPLEVVARLRNWRRRRLGASPAAELRAGPLRLDAGTRSVHWHDRPVTLSNREFRLMQLFLHSRGRVVCRSDLEQTLYGDDREILSNAVDVHVHNLRRKLARDAIKAVRGVGYRLGPGLCDA